MKTDLGQNVEDCPLWKMFTDFRIHAANNTRQNLREDASLFGSRLQTQNMSMVGSQKIKHVKEYHPKSF